MQIVIELDEKLYTTTKSLPDFMCDTLQTAIKNGVPLPEGHGKLIDISTIDKDRIEQDNPVIYLTVNGEYIEAVSIDYLESLPVIVEADGMYVNG